MTSELTSQEKIEIINSHKKNVAYNLYNVNISIIEEKAKASPNQDLIANLNIQTADIQNQIAALDAEITKLISEPSASN